MNILHPMKMTYFQLFAWVWDGNILRVNLGKILGLMSAVSKISHLEFSLAQTSNAATCVGYIYFGSLTGPDLTGPCHREEIRFSQDC